MRDVPSSGGLSTAMAPLVLRLPFISIAFPAEAEGCFHPSPSRKKSLIQGIENICKSNYLPRALPTPPPPSGSWQLRLSPILLLFRVHKGLSWLDLGSAWQRLCPLLQCPSLLQCFQPQLPLPPGGPNHEGLAAHLWPWDGWWEPRSLARGLHPGSAPHSPVHLLQGCAMGDVGDPVPAPPSSGPGLLALLLASLISCGERDRVHKDTPSRLLSH